MCVHVLPVTGVVNLQPAFTLCPTAAKFTERTSAIVHEQIFSDLHLIFQLTLKMVIENLSYLNHSHHIVLRSTAHEKICLYYETC